MATNVNEPWADCDMLSEPKHKEEELIECKSYQIQEPNPINLYELYNNIVEFSDLKGKTLNAVVVFSDELIVFMTDDYTYIMAHEQDCCESVTIDDVCGDLVDIIGDPKVDVKERPDITNYIVDRLKKEQKK